MSDAPLTEKQTIKRVLEAIKPYRLLLMLSMLSMAMVAGLSGTQAWMVKPLLDKIFFEQNKDILNLLPGE